MSVPIRAEPAAHAQPRAKRCSAPAPAITAFATLTLPEHLALVALLLLIAGCSAPPPAPLAGPNPADPGASAPQSGYRSVIAPYESRRPVEPGTWREQNQDVAPRPRS